MVINMLITHSLLQAYNLLIFVSDGFFFFCQVVNIEVDRDVFRWSPKTLNEIFSLFTFGGRHNLKWYIFTSA